MLRASVVAALVLIVSACGPVIPSTPTAPATLTGPTLAPTDDAFPAPPTEVPSNFIDDAGANDPTAAALPNDQQLPPLILAEVNESGGQTVEVTLDNGVLNGALYTNAPNAPLRVPGVMLLTTQPTTVWGTFPRRLEEAGFVVLVMQVPAAMSDSDFQLVVKSFTEFAQGFESRLDPARIAIIGEGEGANIALLGCAVEPSCDMIGLLSPTSAVGQQAIAGRPLLVAASESDIVAFSTFNTFEPAQNVTLQPFTDAGTGAAMFTARPDFVGFVVEWLNRALRP